jgi:hypothetical protein
MIRTPINPLPKINRTEKIRKIKFAMNAITTAFIRNKSICSDSILSFVNTISPNPVRRSKSMRSSAKLVLKVVNIFVSRNDEYTANTGKVNLKSNHK